MDFFKTKRIFGAKKFNTILSKIAYEQLNLSAFMPDSNAIMKEFF